MSRPQTPMSRRLQPQPKLPSVAKLRAELADPENTEERKAEVRSLLAQAAVGFRKSRDLSLYYAQQTLDAIPAAPQNEKLWRGVAQCHLQDAERLLREAELAESPL